jgi:GDP-D-mannose dehydratase
MPFRNVAFVTGSTGHDGSRLAEMLSAKGCEKLLGVSGVPDDGWTSKIGLRTGLESMIEWYRQHVGPLHG